jgi:hypothetical protein
MSNSARNDLDELTTVHQLIEEALCDRLMDISAGKNEDWLDSFEIKEKRIGRLARPLVALDKELTGRSINPPAGICPNRRGHHLRVI